MTFRAFVQHLVEDGEIPGKSGEIPHLKKILSTSDRSL